MNYSLSLRNLSSFYSELTITFTKSSKDQAHMVHSAHATAHLTGEVDKDSGTPLFC